MLPLLLSLALAFPTRTAPEVGVGDPVLGRVPFSQSHARIASNGTLALAVWDDSRTGTPNVFASRVDRSGKPLDVTGFVVRENTTLDDVFWSGEAFVVLTGSPRTYELTFVDTDGKIVQRTPIGVNAYYATRTDERASTRLLFLPADGSSAAAAIVDLQGRVIKPETVTSGVATVLAAASNENGFLVLRSFSTSADGSSFITVAERLDRDGNFLRMVDTRLPASLRLEGAATLTADGRGGFALIASEPAGIVLHPLSDLGTANRAAVVIQPPQELERGVAPPVALRTNDGFVVTWSIRTEQVFNFISKSYASYSGGTPLAIYGCRGDAERTAMDPTATLVVSSCDDPYYSATGEDVFVAAVHSSDQPLTLSAALQTNAAVAAGENGFLAAWCEKNGGGVSRYVGRFAGNGDAQATGGFFVPFEGDPPSEERLATPTIASSGDTYLVVWDDGWAGRFDARTGGSMDFMWRFPNVQAIAGNGTSLMTIQGGGLSLYAQRVETHGDPLVSRLISIRGADSAGRAAIASNGTDYLVVWASRGAPQMLAMRLRADGTSIDGVPYVLDTAGDNPSVAWNGKTYLATWSKPGGDIGAAYVSSEGGVEPLGTIAHAIEAKTIAHAGEFLIFTHTLSGDGDQWLGMTLGDEAATIVTRPNRNFGTLGAASNGAYLVLVYDRVDEANGRVGRVFLDRRVFRSRRHIAN